MGTSILQENALSKLVTGISIGTTSAQTGGAEPFTLDSPEPTASFREFLESEVRYFSLLKAFPDIAEELFAQAEADAKDRYDEYRRLAAMEY